MKLPKSVINRVCAELKDELVSADALAGGSINSVFHVKLASHSDIVIKCNPQAPECFFSAERFGLRLLEKCGARVPQVVMLEDSGEDCQPFIALEYLPPGNESVEAQEQFAKMLAHIHRTRCDSWGLATDNFIGSLPQRNTPELSSDRTSWAEFFIEYRLKEQADLGQQNGWFTRDFMELFLEKETAMLSLLETAKSVPSLVHGDLWSGNVYWSEGGPVLIDPAVYYGHREVDLAFLGLFGDPGTCFWQSYQEELPIEEGFELRKHILNLYHLMNHANLFGSSYVQTVWRVLKAV